MQTIETIIKRAGGVPALAVATGLTGAAIKKWRIIGIPDRHWDAVMPLARVSERALLAANRAVRAGKPPKIARDATPRRAPARRRADRVAA